MCVRLFTLCLFWVFAKSLSAQTPTFTIDFPGGQCVPAPVVFENTTSNVVAQIWNVETPLGIVIDTSQSTIATYGSFQGAGLWSATLFVTYANGDTASLTQVFELTVPPVINAIAVIDTQGCAPFQTCFYADITANAPYTFAWDFCDSTTYSIAFPCHTFDDTGCYCATLVVTDASGCITDTTFEDLVCVIGYEADFVADVVYSPCPPLEVNFANLSPDTSILSFTMWDYGDLSAPTYLNNGFHEYTQPGCYDVTMIVADTDGCIDTVFKPCYIEVGGPFADITTISDGTCGPLTVCFTIDSTNSINSLLCPDNGTTCISISTGTVCFEYDTFGVYNPTILICDDIGCCFEKQLDPVYVDSINASFGVSQNIVCGLDAVQFYDSSFSAIGTIASHHWDLGDGNTSTLENPSHIYADTGCYDVTLVATGLGGCSDTMMETEIVCVLESVSADIVSPNPSYCDTPHTVCFSNAAINTTSTSFSWTFIGGTPAISNIDSPCIVYNSPGVFDVMLAVSAANGCSDTAFLNNYVNVGIAIANLTATDTLGNIGDTLGFLISPAGTSTIWTVTPSTGVIQIGLPSPQIEILFLQPDTFNVCGAITIPGGCTAEDCIEVIITDTIDSTNPLNSKAAFIHLTPNPTSHQAVLKIQSNSTENISINLLSIDGKILSTKNFNLHQGVNEIQLGVTEFQNGIYMLQVKSSAVNATRKLVIQR